MDTSRVFSQYQKTNVGTADQRQLILMMYDGAIRYAQQAQLKLKSNDILGKGLDIAKAQRIVSELQSALDLKKGGEIAVSLDTLYVFVNNQLSMANLKNSQEYLNNAIAVLKELREAWQGITLSQTKPSVPLGDQVPGRRQVGTSP
jgi:flagellar protein FliS